jgi:hypothetical protein
VDEAIRQASVITTVTRRPILMAEDLSAYRIPEEGEFKRTRDGGPILALAGEDQLEDTAYIAAPGLERIARAITIAHPDAFAHLNLNRVRFRWKRVGGVSGGAMLFGKCRKLSDALADALPGRDFLIYLAADNCRDAGFDPYDVELTLAHEMLHTANDEKGKPICLPHPLEIFPEEVDWYGLHSPELKTLARIIRRLPPPKDEPTLFDGLDDDAATDS